MRKILKILCALFPFFPLLGTFDSHLESHQKKLVEENQRIADSFKKIEQFYHLDKKEAWREITQEVLESPYTPEKSKTAIQTHQRRIILFKYPSNGLSIKGFISFTSHPSSHPLLILFRGGNENFGLLNPGIPLATYGDYTVLSSSLRGGVSEGKDEFGGHDVDDVKNMIDFIPSLNKELGIEINPSCVYMLGLSRGGLEMILTLARYPRLQNRINKIVALSSLLDINLQIKNRPHDMKQMFERKFGMPKEHPQHWIAKRNPVQMVPYLNQSLPILIIQGTADQRVSLDEGHEMVEKLKESGHLVEYWEVPGGQHVLSNKPHLMQQISAWLDYHSKCLKCAASHDQER